MSTHKPTGYEAQYFHRKKALEVLQLAKEQEQQLIKERKERRKNKS